MNYRDNDLNVNVNMPDDEDFNGPGSGNIKSMILSQLVPEEYIFDPLNAEPTLDTLRHAALQYSGEIPNNQAKSTGHGTEKELKREADTALKALLEAAETDVNIHMSRVKAVLAQDPKLLETYSKYTDLEIQSRIQRLEEMQQQRKDLNADTQNILNNLNENIDMNSPSKQKKENLSQANILERRLSAWEKALQMYIYGNVNDDNNNHNRNLSIVARSKQLTMIQLLQHLCLTSTTEDEDTLTQALSQAEQMTTSHLDRTYRLLQDAVEETADSFQSYHIHLIAHSVAAITTLKRTGVVQAKFLHHGKEALRIGHALEVAEAKRRQSEHASMLLRRWWMMENLAEQEHLSGEEIRVQEEVRGVIPSSSCRMDPLFTRQENSLEAAKTLKSLRTIVKCRSNNVNPVTGEGANDFETKERFESTNTLILRTSAALEQRLLNTFSEIYTAGGVYDFSSIMAPKRAGRLNWMMLREVSEALMSFDSGRSLHKRYVGLVVRTKFPELFMRKAEDGEDGGAQEEDIDGTRSKLSNLFHRVCEVCTEEFQLIAHTFSNTLPPHLQGSSISSSGKKIVSNAAAFPDTFPLQVARALLQRLISDPENGMQAQINGLLESIDQRGDFDAGAKKLDTFVVIHEKAAGLFHLLKEAAQNMWKTHSPKTGQEHNSSTASDGAYDANAQSISALIQFLTTQEMSLSNGQRKGYLNLELRLLHHHCCVNLDRNGGKLMKPVRTKEDSVRNSMASGGLADYRSPIMPLDQDHIRKGGFVALLNGPLKQSVLRQPLIHATDSLARARLMFGSGTGGGEGVDSTARVVSNIFSQMCNFYGPSYLYPIIDSLGKMLVNHPPNAPPSLPFDESAPPYNLGVDGNFWITIERIHSAAKSFDRELWAENRTGSVRVWEILVQTRSQTSLTVGKERRIRFFQELEERGEAVILRSLDTLSAHIHWIMVTGGEATVRSNAGARRGDGPYAVPSGYVFDAASTNSPAVKALTYCLRSQFVHVQSALTPQSLSAFWISLSRRVYDILVARLLQNYKVSTDGAVVLSRDVEALRSVCMLAGNEHYHWDNLRELLTLYMTPPDLLKTMLVGADGDINSGKGMFGRVGKDQSIVFMSRRVDYRYRTNQGSRKSQWVKELLEALGVNDPTDGRVNIANYAAENITSPA
jgi:hypothetical protein